MISPHTAPGTKVVCIRESDFPEAKIRLGEVYTVKGIIESPIFSHEFGVQLEEHELFNSMLDIPWGYALSRFRLAELPRCLTALLTTVPTKELEDA